MSNQASLPPAPNIRHLRNQSKDLLRSFKSGEPRAAARVRESLPQMTGRTDAEVLQSRFALKDAQSVVAREYGFEDWLALKRHVEDVSAESRERVFDEGNLPEPVAAILRAVEDGDADRVREMLEREPGLVHVRVRSDYEEGDTLLHRADHQRADDGNDPHDPRLRVAQLLIDYGADVDAVGGRGNTVGATPLDAASWAGNVGMVRLLLANGADPEKGGPDGVDYNPVSTAVSHGRVDVFRLLAAAGARYSIQHTIRMGLLEETRALLDADPALLHRTRRADPRWPEGELPLALAAGRPEIFRLLLERGADVRAKDARGYTPLMAARAVGSEWAVRDLLSRGAPDDVFGAIMDKDAARLESLLRDDPSAAAPVGPGPAPLTWAARYGDRETIRLLLEHGANPNVWQDADQSTSTPLKVAVTYQGDDVIRLLLEHGADPEFAGEGERSTALSVAIRNGSVRSIDLLLDAGGDPNRVDNFFGAWGGNLPKIKLLLDRGRVVGNDRPVGARGQEDLSIAAGNGQNAAVELLVCHGANLEYVDKDRLTAIQQAKKERWASTVDLLNEHADICRLPDREARMALERRRRFIDAFVDGGSAEVEAILDDDPTLLTLDIVRSSLLHDAAWNGRGDVVDAMVARGAPMTIHAAAALGRVETVQAFMDSDAALLESLYVDRPMAECTPLKAAAARNQANVAAFLLDHGADIDGQATRTPGGEGKATALHAAVSKGAVGTLRLLLERGANVNLKNWWGAAPIELNWPARNGDRTENIHGLLVAYGADPKDQPSDLVFGR